jgi:uncharacterized protein (DUF427 family)
VIVDFARVTERLSMPIQYIKPGPGQESVWDYPRPPRLEPTNRHIQVVFNNVMVADSWRALRVLETSHPPVYYIPPEDIQMIYLSSSMRSSYCEWKGKAAYYSLVVGERREPDAAWYYPNPTLPYAALKDHVAFYPKKMDACLVDGEPVRPQPGTFYGGWITPDVVGPFKGEPGTESW